MTALFDKLLHPILWEEGVHWDAAGAVTATGLVDDPQDPGGLTNWGFAINAHPDLTVDQLRAMTYDQAVARYAATYWAPIGGDLLPPALGLITLDAVIQHGQGEGVELLQEALRFADTQVDGVLGPATRIRIGAFRLVDLIADFQRLRLYHYQAQPNWLRDRDGWLRRMFRITQAAGALA